MLTLLCYSRHEEFPRIKPTSLTRAESAAISKRARLVRVRTPATVAQRHRTTTCAVARRGSALKHHAAPKRRQPRRCLRDRQSYVVLERKTVGRPLKRVSTARALPKREEVCLYALLDLERAKLLKRVAEIEALLEISASQPSCAEHP
jgi:hypothetical protein